LNPSPIQQTTGHITFCCSANGCVEEFTSDAKARAGARHDARKAGWSFVKVDGLNGKVEVWKCAQHTAEYLAKRNKRRKEGLLVYSDEGREAEKQDDSDLKEAIQRHVNTRKGDFELHYHHALNGAQMSACLRLRSAIQSIEISGNASMSYDGVGIDRITFGAKTIQESVLDAIQFLKACKRAVQSDVQPFHHDAWRIFEHAIIADLTPQMTGQFICESRGDKMGRERQRALAIEIVGLASAAILKINY